MNNVELNVDIITEIANIIPKTIINDLYILLLNKLDSYIKLSNYINTILNNGYSATNIINDLSINILNDTNINDKIRSDIFIKMSDICNLLSNGSGDYIQLLALCSFINKKLN